MSDPLISAGVTLSKFLNISASFAVVGTLLAMAFLLLDTEGKLSTSAQKLRSILQLSALLWLIGSVGTILFTLANILGQSFTAAFDLTVMRSFLTQVTLGQYFLFQTLISVVALLSAKKIQRINTTISLLVLSIIGIIFPVFQSHAASSGSHSLAIGSLVVHVVGLALWVGGIFALIFIDSKDRIIAVPRFSVLALWSAIAVVISGSANAWVRLDFKSAWQTTYALVVVAKIVLTIALLAMGYLHRKNLSKKPAINWVAMARLIMVEAFIMASALALGAWLSSNQAPIRKSDESAKSALTLA